MNEYKMSSKSVNDKFYTKRDTSNKIVKYCFSEFPELRDKEFFECSAGDGSFIDALNLMVLMIVIYLVLTLILIGMIL